MKMNMREMMKSEEISLRAIGEFLSQYSVRLLGCGATCVRLEKNVRRMADALGVTAEITIMPRHINLTVSKSGDAVPFTISATVMHPSISFFLNTRLSRLSWELADGKIDFDTARKRMMEIVASDTQNKWMVLFLASFANAAFCRLFGGDCTAMAIVFMATLAGYFVKLVLLECKVDLRVVFMVCAFVSSVLGATDSLFSLGGTPEVAISTSVLYLVPGIPFLNSFSDMLYRHYICAFSRFVDAMVLTCCLSAGLCGGVALMNISIL